MNVGKNGHPRRKKTRLFDHRATQKIGLPPGSVVAVGEKRDFAPYVDLIQYSGTEFRELDHIQPRQIADEIKSARVESVSDAGLLKANHVNWINVEGVHETSLVQEISAMADIHPLTQEDIVNTLQRPQFEAFPGYYFFAIKMLSTAPDHHLDLEHVSLVLKGNTLLTFQEKPGDVFERVRNRIRSGTGQVRGRGADYLLYLLIDSIVDSYYQVVDDLAERIDQVEDEIRGGLRDEQLTKVFELRRETLFLRKNIVPVRDLLNKVQVEGGVFQNHTKLYLKDLYDHVTQVHDALTLAMEMTAVMIDTYHSMQNQRLNSVMKTLTVISTFFLPLNFIAGVYGMNFKHMPELDWEYGYPTALLFMLTVGLFMIFYFFRKGWLFENRFRRTW